MRNDIHWGWWALAGLVSALAALNIVNQVLLRG